MSPRILFVDHTARLGGAELALLDIAPYFPGARLALFEDGELAEAARERGIAVELIGNGAATGIRRESGLLPVLRAAPALAPLALRLAKAARSADLVYANSQKSAAVAALAARIARRPLVWHLHDMLTADHFSAVMRGTVLRLTGNATRVIVNSEATGRAYVTAGGRGEIARVVYNGIDETPFEDDAPAPEADAALAGLPRPVIGVFGRLAPWKAQHVALWALRVFGRGSLLIVGDALFGETAYRESLATQIDQSQLTGRVRMLGERRDVPALMRRCDIIAHTSIAPEPFGRVVVEGMLAGRPVIATNAGGPAEIIEDGVSGLLVPPNSPRALAEAFARLARDEGMAVRLGRRGREWALWNFTLARTNPQIAAVIDEALGMRELKALPAPAEMV